MQLSCVWNYVTVQLKLCLELAHGAIVFETSSL